MKVLYALHYFSNQLCLSIFFSKNHCIKLKFHDFSILVPCFIIENFKLINFKSINFLMH